MLTSRWNITRVNSSQTDDISSWNIEKPSFL